MEAGLDCGRHRDRGRNRLVMKKLAQRSMHCRCGRAKTIARGLCGTCYTLKRQDEEHFGGLREQVLERDGYRCRVCAALPEVDRLCVGQPPSVHHRMTGISKLQLMITLCAGHHAMVTRTLCLDKGWPPLLALLWREQHPQAHEQLQLSFTLPFRAPVPVPLFKENPGN